MPAVSARKNKIVLADYNYRRDIENRLLMADFTTFDVDVLQEILNSSLKISIKHLAEALDATTTKITSTLEKLSKTKLLTYTGDGVVVDKEMRKYYEFQLRKFDDNFEPTIEFFQGLLSQIPIHVLPNWYAISRSSDNIFSSIIEKYLLTPKIYEKHLLEIEYDDPTMKLIKEEVFHAPDFKVSAKNLMNKLSVTRERFEECLLYLEYNLVCTLSYNCIADRWQEVITPYYEWREYLRFQRDSELKQITDDKNILFKQNEQFVFLKDLAALLELGKKGSLDIQKHEDGGYTLTNSLIKACKPAATKEEGAFYKTYYSKILAKAITLELIEISNEQVKLTDDAQKWLKKSFEDQALILFRLPIDSKHGNEKNIREIEKSLKRVIGKGWIDFESFMLGLTAPLGNVESVTLKCKGKRWKYILPEYSTEDFTLVKTTIFERLFEAGVVSVGEYKGKSCFAVTAFGRLSIGD